MRPLYIATLPFVILMGCVAPPTHIHHDPRFDFRSTARHLFSHKFAYTADTPFHIRKKLIERTELYNLFHLIFTDGARTLAAVYIQRKDKAPKKLILILPIYDSEHTYPGDIIQQGLADTGKADILRIQTQSEILFDWTALAQSQTPEIFLNEIKRSRRRVHDAITDLRRMIDALQTQRKTSQQIGIVGFSIGAIIANLALCADARISAGALVMTGGNLDETFAYSTADYVQKTRNTLLRRFGWTRAHFQKAIAPYLHDINPLRYSACADPSRVIMVDAQYDNLFSQRTRDMLWRALGKPDRYIVPAGHKMAFLGMTIFGGFRINTIIETFFERIW